MSLKASQIELLFRMERGKEKSSVLGISDGLAGSQKMSFDVLPLLVSDNFLENLTMLDSLIDFHASEMPTECVGRQKKFICHKNFMFKHECDVDQEKEMPFHHARDFHFSAPLKRKSFLSFHFSYSEYEK